MKDEIVIVGVLLLISFGSAIVGAILGGMIAGNIFIEKAGEHCAGGYYLQEK